MASAKEIYFGGAYFLYKDVFDRTPVLEEIYSLLRDLDSVETVATLCRINTELRLAKRERTAIGKLQQTLGGAFLDEEMVARFKRRFGTTDMADRPIFHTPQVLNILRLVVQNSNGSQKPTDDRLVGDKIGTACLMMNDLMLTSEEEKELSSSREEEKARVLMTQMLGPFEIVNTANITHLIYRSRIMFYELLKQKSVVERIQRTCSNFDFEREFHHLIGMSLTRWLFLVFICYAYFAHYVADDGSRRLEFLVIDRTKFRGESTISDDELKILLRTVSLPLKEFKQLLDEHRPADWRFDYVPFKSKPLVEVATDKVVCHDLGFLVEKMHSGVFWTINDCLDTTDRPKLFKAWGILFEEYVNWFLNGRQFKQPLFFVPSPQWSDGSECFDGAFVLETRFMPMEYKGGFLKIESRYSGDKQLFESELDKKIGAGVEQLVRKIEALFHVDPKKRKQLKQLPLDHITRIVPVLVVQDQILRGPFINWWLNKKFISLLDRSKLRAGVVVDSLNVVGINELESMVESAEGGSFDFFHALQLRCHLDPEMHSELHNFLMRVVPNYGQGKSDRIEKLLVQQWAEMEQSLFGDVGGTRAQPD